MSTKRELPKTLQTPSSIQSPVVQPDEQSGGDELSALGVAVAYRKPPAADPSGTPTDSGGSPRPDAPSEAVAIPRQPAAPLPELPAGSQRLSSGIVRTLSGGVEISSRPDNSVPFTFPSVPSKVETLRKGIVRSTM